MKKNCTFLITAIAIIIAGSGVCFGEWLEPVLLDEINDNSGYNPESPALSPDGLTLYYGKFNPARGHKCLYEAKRESLCTPFVKTRMLEELIVEGANMNAPWISMNEQRLYYHEVLSTGGARTKMAVWNADNNLWIPTEIFDELGTAVSISLSADELIIAGHIPSENSMAELFIASRESVESPFDNFRVMSELNTIYFDVSPHLSSDGLSVYFVGLDRKGKPTQDFYRATRDNTEVHFVNIKLVEFPGYNSMYENDCFLSSDENTMHFFTGAGIWEMQNTEKYPMLEIIGASEISRKELADYDVQILLGKCQTPHSVSDNEIIWSVDPPEIYGELDKDGRFIPSNGVPSGLFTISAEIIYNHQILSASKTISIIKESVSFFVDGQNGNNDNTGYAPENAFATVMRGINACQDGDVVYIIPGVYSGAVDFKGKAIIVSGYKGAAIIDGSDGFGVSFFNDEGRSSVLQNIVIYNSYIGIYAADSSPTIQNVTVTGNTYGIEAYQGSEPDINNCIVWDNTESDLFECRTRYSCVENGVEEAGNISENPLFVNAAGGDYRLLSERGRYHAESGMWILDEHTSPCINSGDPAVNPLNEPGANGGRINMGAYGGTIEASMGKWGLKGDLNRDGKVNIADLSEIASSWLQELSWME